MRLRHRTVLAALPWIAHGIVVFVVVCLRPAESGVIGIYGRGCERFADGLPMHGAGIHGFLYLPVFALVFAPFHALPAYVGGLLWRAVGLTLWALAAYRLCRHLAPERARWALFISGLLVIPAGMNALTNGQANLWIAALLVHVAVDVRERRLIRASWIATFALAIKPIAIVPLLLFGALERRMIPHLLLGLVVLFAFPFAFADPAYVWAQYEGFVGKLTRANAPVLPYTEFFGGLQRLGLDVPHVARQTIRALVALGVLAVCWRCRRREGPETSAMLAMSLAAAYLMAFNPVTEANSYVILAAVLAPQAAATWFSGRGREAVLLAAGCLALGTHEVRGPVHEAAKRWLKPLLALGYGAWVMFAPAPGSRAPAAPAARPGSRRPAAAGRSPAATCTAR